MSDEQGFRFYISSGLLTAEHVQRIGSAVWEFLWLISHETRQEGKVLNGSPITGKRIAAELGRHPNTVFDNLEKLTRQGYVARVRGIGNVYTYQIANSKKWKTPENCDSDSQKTGLATRKTVTGNPENCDTNKEVDRYIGRQVDSKRATRLPEDFIPSEEHYALGQQLGVNTDMEFQKFRDYFLGVPGSKGLKLDWAGTLRNWLRNSVNYQRGRYGQQQQPISASQARSIRSKQNILEGFARNARRADAPNDVEHKGGHGTGTGS